MNVLGLAQGANLRILARIVELVRSELALERLGIFVADAAHFLQSSEAQSLEADGSVIWLKEWELLQVGLGREEDSAVLSRYEAEVGPPGVWAALLADRRIFFGRYCKVRQDYTPRYSQQQMLGAVTEALERIEDLLLKVKPDIVVGFVPVTLHEFLILRLAEARGIPFLLLRSTKIANLVSLNDRLMGLSNHIEKNLKNEIQDAAAAAIAHEYIESTCARGAVYEGMHHASHAHRHFRMSSVARAIVAGCKHEFLRRRSSVVMNDPHNPGYLVPILIEQFLQPWRASQLRQLVARSGRSLGPRDTGYCLYPLHFEPEIALQIYGRPFQNQIEVARMLALALPAGMKLVVKEHPRAAGFRPRGYYKKLLSIPNVILALPEEPSHRLVRTASLVAIITGNIGLEAAVLGKPVLVLGQADYSVLPSHMLRTCHNPYELCATIRDLLAGFRPDRPSLERYLTAVAAGSVAIDLYSVLLRKGGRHSFNGEDFDRATNRLATYVLRRVCESAEGHEAGNV